MALHTSYFRNLKNFAPGKGSGKTKFIKTFQKKVPFLNGMPFLFASGQKICNFTPFNITKGFFLKHRK